MARLNVAPTKSNYLALSRQLEFAEEGFELLEQKRQILVFELMSRLGRARDIERRMADTLGLAFAELRQSTLDSGAANLDAAIVAVSLDRRVTIEDQHVMGIALPKLALRVEKRPQPRFGVGGTSSRADTTMQQFVALLPLLIELTELENSVMRLARELRKTQRRCNALSRVFIPEHTRAIDYISASLEEREREAFIILRMIKERLIPAAEQPKGDCHV